MEAVGVGTEIKKRKNMGQKLKGTEGQTNSFGAMGLYPDIAELNGLLIKSIDITFRLAKFASQVCHFEPMQNWAMYLTPLWFTFLIYKLGIMKILSTWLACYQN